MQFLADDGRPWVLPALLSRYLPQLFETAFPLANKTFQQTLGRIAHAESGIFFSPDFIKYTPLRVPEQRRQCGLPRNLQQRRRRHRRRRRLRLLLLRRSKRFLLLPDFERLSPLFPCADFAWEARVVVYHGRHTARRVRSCAAVLVDAADGLEFVVPTLAAGMAACVLFKGAAWVGN